MRRSQTKEPMKRTVTAASPPRKGGDNSECIGCVRRHPDDYLPLELRMRPLRDLASSRVPNINLIKRKIEKREGSHRVQKEVRRRMKKDETNRNKGASVENCVNTPSYSGVAPLLAP